MIAVHFEGFESLRALSQKSSLIPRIVGSNPTGHNFCGDDSKPKEKLEEML